MKTTVKFFPMALLFVLSATFVNAQNRSWNADPAETANQQTAEMTEKLSLSTKQAEKIGEINLKYANKMKEARDANEDGDWSTIRETVQQLRQEQNAELKNVMTAAQFEKWEKIQVERRKARQDRGGQRGKDKKTQEKQG